jgi:hypothetical protein
MGTPARLLMLKSAKSDSPDKSEPETLAEFFRLEKIG